MTTVTEIINAAFREVNLTAVGTAPTASETTEALALFNRLVSSLYSDEAGEALNDLPYGEGNVDTPEFLQTTFDDFDDEYIPVNTRLILNLQSAKTINLPLTPMDGARIAVVDASNNLATYNLVLNGNGRLVEGLTSKTLNTNGQRRAWFYRADLSDWKVVTDLVGGDDSPFPIEFDDLLIIGLAARLMPRHGSPLSEASTARYSELSRKFRARYRQSIEKESDPVFRHIGEGRRYYSYTRDHEFERGRNLW